MPDPAAGPWSLGPDGAWRFKYRPMPAAAIAARRVGADLPLSVVPGRAE